MNQSINQSINQSMNNIDDKQRSFDNIMWHSAHHMSRAMAYMNCKHVTSKKKYC